MIQLTITQVAGIPRKLKTIATGLNKDQRLDIALYGYNSRVLLVWLFNNTGTGSSGGIDCNIDVQNIEVRSKTYNIRKMKKSTISKIFISFSDCLMSKYSAVSQKLESVQSLEVNGSVVITNKLITTREDVLTPLKREPCLRCSGSSTTPDTVSAAKAKQLLSTTVKFFADKMCCDITIQVDGGQQIRAHKLVLASGSTVMRQLITNDDKLSSLAVPNLDIEIIEALITYIYTGTISEPPKAIKDLFIAADTYGVVDLKILCEQHLLSTCTMDSAINLLVLAHKYNAKELFGEVFNFVRHNIAELKQRDEWKMLFFAYPELAIEIFSKITT